MNIDDINKLKIFKYLTQTIPAKVIIDYFNNGGSVDMLKQMGLITKTTPTEVIEEEIGISGSGSGSGGHDYSSDYLTIVSLEDNNTIGWKAYNASNVKTISISTDDGQTWNDITSTTNGETLAVLNTDDKLLLKGNNLTYSTSSYYNYFTSTGNFNVEGNIMSLIYQDDFAEQTVLSENYTFSNLFRQSKIVDASNLVIPATTLVNDCYSYMFFNCTSLTIAPEILPATTLTYECYLLMFQNCSKLTTTPILPATTLAVKCYQQMFYGCNKLNYIECLATDISTLDCVRDWLYNTGVSGTFIKDPSMTGWTRGASGIPTKWNIMDVDELPIKWSESSYTTPINISVVKFINPFNLPVTFSSSDDNIATIDNTGNIEMLSEGTCTLTATFKGDQKYKSKTVTCTLTVTEYSTEALYLTIISTSDNNVIKITSTESHNYGHITIYYSRDNGSNWFSVTSSMNGTTIATLNNGDKLLLKGNNASYVSQGYANIFGSTGTFNMEGNIMSLVYGDNFIGQKTLSSARTFDTLFKNCMIEDASGLVLPATTLTTSCYNQMFYGCTSLTTAPKLPATTLTMNCYSHMFRNCTALIKAPELPATTLATECYKCMFYGCTSLNQITCLATDISATDCTAAWVSNVAASGTFVKDPSMSSWTTGTSGIPEGWTVEDIPA